MNSGVVTSVLDDVIVSNGLGWTADRRTMFYIDSGTRAVDVFDVDDSDGALHDRRRIAQLDFAVDEGPDGLAVDTDGCAWVATWAGGCVRRYTPRGDLDIVVPIPMRDVTSVAFGGAGLDQLYITTARSNLDAEALRLQPHAGDIFALDLSTTGISGVPISRFGALSV